MQRIESPGAFAPGQVRPRTVGEAVNWAAGRVRYVSPRLGAELLAGRVLGRSRAAILAHPEMEIGDAQWSAFADLVERCSRGEPLFYLLGEREFFGLMFHVDRRVLIPRPETEHLVEHALAWLSANPAARRAVDVGTGSGCIAVSVAVHWKSDEGLVQAVDVSEDALQVASANSARHGVENRVHAVQSDLLQGVMEPADLILANLPYVSQAEWPDLETPVVEFEPRVALDGGPDGLDLIGWLLEQAPAKLRPGGALMLEIGYAQAPAVRSLAEKAFPAARIAVDRDLAGLDRIVVIQT